MDTLIEFIGQASSVAESIGWMFVGVAVLSLLAFFVVTSIETLRGVDD